jgi:hypothetical protein
MDSTTKIFAVIVAILIIITGCAALAYGSGSHVPNDQARVTHESYCLVPTYDYLLVADNVTVSIRSQYNWTMTYVIVNGMNNSHSVSGLGRGMSLSTVSINSAQTPGQPWGLQISMFYEIPQNLTEPTLTSLYVTLRNDTLACYSQDWFSGPGSIIAPRTGEMRFN